MTIEEVLRPGANKVMYNVDGAAVPFVEKYFEVFGEHVACNTCAGILYEAYLKLKNYMAKPNQIIEEIALENLNTEISLEPKYTIIDGVVICTTFSSSVPGGEFTKDNITDEIAEKLLAENFEAYSSVIILK